jgi:hypothetical protein
MSATQNPPIENQLKSTENWYTSWFDSPYYHILYIEIIEAQVFMDNLTHYLQEKANVLDLACRSSFYLLKSIGFYGTGADLSENSILEAAKTRMIAFTSKCMICENHLEEKFDCYFNLFTSFGYFENDEDNLNYVKT